MTIGTIEWETVDGETYGYADNGWEITITARTPYRAGYRMESNIRTWAVQDEENRTVSCGEADGLRAAKRAALDAFKEGESKRLHSLEVGTDAAG